MNVKTKFKIGDNVYLIRDSKVQKRTIKKINIWVSSKLDGEPDVTISYSFTENRDESEWETNVFGSLDELFADIKSKLK